MHTDTLEQEIATLAAQLTAATARLLDCIRRFDESEAWHEQGFRSCAHWLSWRIGLDIGAAREKVRVARALAQLPHLRTALERGELSYAKARAATRIATPDNEREWVFWMTGYRTLNQARNIRFLPLYEIVDQPYTVYFPVQPAG